MNDNIQKNKELTLEEIHNFRGKYPKQLIYLFLIEMWERFCFYGMRGVLTIFMVGQLGVTDKDSNLKYGAIQAFIYAFTFIGGILADKILGFKKSLFIGGLTMVLGNLIIAYSPHDFFYFGITLSIIGTGFFKPNISTMVGDLYSEKDARRDAGFGLFYSGINLGALFGGVLCVYLGKYHSWNLCFLAAAIVMLIGILIFLATKKYLGPIGDSPLIDMKPSTRRTREMFVYLGVLLCIPIIYAMIHNTRYTDYFMYTIGPLAIALFIIELIKIKSAQIRKKLVAAMILIIFSILFFAFFEQSGGALAIFAEGNLSHKLLFFNIDPNIVNNSSNALFVIILSPLFGLLWLWLAKIKLEPNTVIKFGLGFLFLSGSFYILYSTRYFADSNGMTSLNIFTIAYLVMTFAELCLSPVGLSIVTKLSPKNLSGMMMGMWFLASSYAQYVAGLLGAEMSSPDENASLVTKLYSYTTGFGQLANYALITGIALILFSPLIRKLMQEVK